MDLLELTDVLISWNWVPIPLRGKVPRLPRWQQTTIEKARSKIESLVNSGQCTNIGIVCGEASGIVVLDVDVDDNGLDMWNQYIEIYGEPDTFKVRTQSGGLHYYFNYSDTNVAKLRNGKRNIGGYGLDFKTTGGQVVAPGNVMSGNVYTIEGGYDEDTGIPKIIDMPDWLFELLYSWQK